MSNSINKNQIEDNYENLGGQDAVKKITELVDVAQTCFFCTSIATGGSSASRPMNVQKVDEQGNLWFMSANDSHTNKEIAMDPNVQLFFQGSPHSDFMHLKGKASISLDRDKIDEFWSPLLKTWFTEGKDDPRISVIKVETSEGYYWDNKHGNAIAGIKMLIGAAIGKTLDDSIEGKLMV